MGLNIIDRIQAKLELLRLEKRYTRSRHRRSTFVSNAIYVDGEYIYQSPNTTGSSFSSSKTSSTAASSYASNSLPQKKLNRWSSMPGFGSADVKPEPRVVGRMPSINEEAWRKKRVSFNGDGRW
ncbi:uncharacterized protein CTHT_0049830 [Thermochaetoides thermophila DSM 1495]|uniref:Uncharacterized protein n=1 Tax=Chaetomium thermophilum (strain DSM 1495 / CBS 144.50 / IMI 039719) TaxID=759272 RepID=G0SBD1_CHATD|nr:hypothetical protein CTHT_0049830 [Thermochaetoides thermophila DSM 1495]EGS19511.1 hypothetical protein CTHT_0049830 [Thermochaetoides thermophila DSM 1495]